MTGVQTCALPIFIIANTANTTAANVQFRRVSTIAELKTLTPIANMTVQVDGYYTKGDGGGGKFWGNTTTGTHTDDGGLVLTSNVTGGTASSSWKRIIEDSINVKWFGAKGDGVTDDTKPLQNATNSFVTTAGNQYPNESRQFYYPKGRYLISAPIRIYSGQNHFGDGYASAIAYSNSFTGNGMFELSGTPGVAYYNEGSIDRLSFTGPNGAGTPSTNTSNMWAIYANTNIIQNSKFTNLGFTTRYGFCIPSWSYGQDLIISKIYCNNVMEQAIKIKANQALIEDVDVEQNSGPIPTNDNPCIELDTCHNSFVRGCIVEGASAYSTKPAIGANNSQFTIEDCWYEWYGAAEFLRAANNCVIHTRGGLNFFTANIDRKSTRLNSSHIPLSRMPSSA